MRLSHHFILVIGTEEHASWPPVQLVIVQAGPADCRSVYDWSHLSEVVQQHFVKEGFVSVLCYTHTHTHMLARVMKPGQHGSLS